MRDPKRIPEVLARLGKLWSANPDLRLGQIVANAAFRVQRTCDPFYIDDDQLMDAIERVFTDDPTSPAPIVVPPGLAS